MSDNNADKTAEIILGGVHYTIKALTWGQVKKILPLFAKAPHGVFTQEGAEAFSDIIVIALHKDYPDVTREFLDSVTGDYKDFVTAVDKIGEISGLEKPKPKEDTTSVGEAKAGESL